MAESAKKLDPREHYNSCCKGNTESSGSPDYIDDSIVIKEFCTQCGAEYTLIYDLAYIEHTATQTPVRPPIW